MRRRVVAEWEEEFARTTPRFGRGVEDLTPAYGGARVEHAGQATQSGGGGFAPSVVPSVEGSPVQFLIITNTLMQAEMQRLADWRTRTGVPTIVRTVEFIGANYPYGFDLQDRIRRFVKEAYEQWGITHLLLAGDTDVIPPRYGRTTFFGGASIPSDLYYSDLDGNWNADGDSLFGEAYQEVSNPGDNVSLIPDVYVGRAPITSVLQAKAFVDKTLQYSRNPVGDYENKALFAGEVLFPQEWVPPASISLDGAEDCESAIQRLTPEMQVLRLYENYVPYASVGALQETRQKVLDSLSAGRGLFHHVGHGYRNSMSVGDAAVTNPDAEALSNGNRLFWLYSINCTSNAIDFASLGEAFMLNPNGGAVANVGSTREDFPVTGRGYQDEFYDLVFQDKVPTVGEAFARQKFPFIGFAFYDNTHRWTQFTLALLGDPTMPLYWRKPPTLTVAAPTNVPLSDTTFVVNVRIAGNPVTGARVCLMKAGEEYEVGTTNGAGDVTMHVRPETAGAAFLTVSAASSRPWQGTVNFTPAAGIVLVQKAANRTIDDDGIDGTVGAGDGAADAGETIDWLLPVTNSGGGVASSVTASLSSSSPYVTVLNAESNYGSIFGSLTANGTAYRVAIAEQVPDGTEVLFRLDMFSGAAHWVDEFRLPIRAPLLVHISNTVVDDGSNGTIGNSNGRLDTGETVDLRVSLRNITTGTARAATATLSTSTSGASVPGGAATFGDVAPNTSATSTNFRVVNSSASDPRFTLTVSDVYGVRFVQAMDMIMPGGVIGLVGTGAASSITLVWKKSASGDLAGYNVYRSIAQAGPFTRMNAIPTDRTAVYVDEGLPSLTRF
ncbi:MAG: C25 family cysteine peptidase, partial [Candidatus Eisenbacteria bacterium]